MNQIRKHFSKSDNIQVYPYTCRQMRCETGEKLLSKVIICYVHVCINVFHNFV